MPDKKIYTIKDIAKKANVSGATVSNALNNTGRFNIETKKRIESIAEDLGYKPNIIARALSLKKTKIIGVFVPEISNEYYTQVISGMEEIANKNGYTIALINTQYDLEKEQNEVEKLTRLFTDGLIFISGSGKFDHVVRSNLNNIPMVCVDREIEGEVKCPSVLIKNTEAMIRAVKYLYGMGHKKIGYFGHMVKAKEITIMKRYKGYLEGLKILGLKAYHNNIYIYDDPNSIDINSAYEIYGNFLRNNMNKIDATAIIVQNDVLAIALIGALKDQGLKVPEDISVMGFDNIAISQFVAPPLTTTKQPKRELGIQGMKILLDIIDKKRTDDEIKYLETSIVERDSIRKYEY
ncbi:MAG: LacI family transcriptional regulator [Actinobacteria bacterium]|nr:LacI family transcriptional regulator [Actinomycetota bacterium]